MSTTYTFEIKQHVCFFFFFFYSFEMNSNGTFEATSSVDYPSDWFHVAMVFHGAEAGFTAYMNGTVRFICQNCT